MLLTLKPYTCLDRTLVLHVFFWCYVHGCEWTHMDVYHLLKYNFEVNLYVLHNLATMQDKYQ